MTISNVDKNKILSHNGEVSNPAEPEIIENTAKSVADDVFELVLKYIQSNKLKVGDRLPSEGKMAVEFGASRGSVREVVRALARLGVLSVQNGRRPEVAKFTGDQLAVLIDHAVQTAQVTVLQTWDMRRTMELRIARLAALRRTQSDIEIFQALSEKLSSEVADKQELTQIDIKLHLAWAAATKNPLYLLNMASLKIVMENTGPIGWVALGSSGGIQSHIELHIEISNAIIAQDADLAEQLMSKHFDQAARALYDAGLE